MAARDHALSTSAARSSALPPTVSCDLCEASMPASQAHLATDGAVLGLIVCSLCVEDAVAARTLEPVTL